MTMKRGVCRPRWGVRARLAAEGSLAAIVEGAPRPGRGANAGDYSRVDLGVSCRLRFGRCELDSREGALGGARQGMGACREAPGGAAEPFRECQNIFSNMASTVVLKSVNGGARETRSE